MRALVFDLETCANAALVELALEAARIRGEARKNGSKEIDEEAVISEMALSPVFGRIVGIGVLDAAIGKPHVWVGEDERELLELFWHHAQGCELFISWNGLSFDLPWLHVRSLVRGVLPSVRISTARYRGPGESNHIDLFALLTDWRGNRTRHLKLDLATVARAFGVKPPMGNGAEIPQLFEAGDLEAVERHLESDLQATLGIWRALGCPGLDGMGANAARNIADVPF